MNAKPFYNTTNTYIIINIKSNDEHIIHIESKNNYSRTNTLFNQTKKHKSLFPNIFIGPESLSEIWKIRVFKILKTRKNVFPKKCRGIIPIPFLYYLPPKSPYLFDNLFHLFFINFWGWFEPETARFVPTRFRNHSPQPA